MNIKLTSFLFIGCGFAGLEMSPSLYGQSVTVQGGSATGGSAVGGSAVGGSATGGTAVGGSATGGSVTGGTVRGGSATATGGVTTPATASATVNGREIRVTASGHVSVNTNDAGAVVDLGGQSLTVSQSKLTLDGNDLGNIPPQTKRLEVTVTDDMLSVKGDGKEIARAKMPGR